MGADSLSRKLTKSCDKEFPWGRGGITAVIYSIEGRVDNN